MVIHDDHTPATKADIRSMLEAVMQALQGMESRMVTKEDLKQQLIDLEDRIKAQMTDLEDRIKAQMTQLEDRIKAQMTDLEDRILVQFEALRHDTLGMLKDVRSNDYQLANHEERIHVLEDQRSARAARARHVR